MWYLMLGSEATQSAFVFLNSLFLLVGAPSPFGDPTMKTALKFASFFDLTCNPVSLQHLESCFPADIFGI